MIVTFVIFWGLLGWLAYRIRRTGEPEKEKKILSIFDAPEAVEPEQPSSDLSVVDKILVGLIAVPVVLSCIAAIAPPIAKDTLLYH
ncbi:MAG: hypothetical protein ACRERV_15795, partial [Methylococcales bacterium]